MNDRSCKYWCICLCVSLVSHLDRIRIDVDPIYSFLFGQSVHLVFIFCLSVCSSFSTGILLIILEQGTRHFSLWQLWWSGGVFSVFRWYLAGYSSARKSFCVSGLWTLLDLCVFCPYILQMTRNSKARANILSRASEVGSPANHPGLRAATRHGGRDPLVHSQVDYPSNNYLQKF